MTVRRNELAVIEKLAPRTIAYLQVPLTPARAAHLAAFTTRHNIDAQALVIDLLDDVIFNIAPECAAPANGASAHADIASFPSTAGDQASAVADKPSSRSTS